MSLFKLKNENVYKQMSPARIILIYVIVGGLWILFSDRLVTYVTPNPALQSWVNTFKGWIFIAVTSWILYLLMSQGLKRIKKSEEALVESESRLRAVFAAADNVSFVTCNFEGVHTKILDFSPGAERMFGYKKEEVIGKEIALLHLEEDVVKIPEIERIILENKNGLEGENFLVRKSGEVFPAQLTVYPILDDKGKAIATIGVAIDISKYKETEAKFNETYTLLKTTIDNIHDVIRVINTDYTIIDCNNECCNLFRTNKDEMIGKKCYSLKNLTEPCCECPLKHTIDSKKSSKIEKYDEHLSKWFDMRTYPILDEEGNVIKIIEHVRDISERKKSEQLLKDSFEENKILLNKAIEYDKLKTEFFSNISHELRTPLTVVFSTLQLLELHKNAGKIASVDDKLNKYIGIMKQNCYRLLRLINNLIDITRIDSGYFKLNLENYNIVSLVKQISLSVSEFIKNNQIELSFESEKDTKVIACDIEKVERVILNLLSNAVKFTKPGGKITVKVTELEDKVAISIKDNGIGISKDNLKIIFERFRQVDSSLTRDFEGSGIGLSLVKSLVEAHHGNILVESELGVGSEFIIELPSRLVDTDNKASTTMSKKNHVEIISIEFSDIYSNKAQ